ncbi:MAG: hypothetical protein O3C60_17635, partial [Planctomycetota bacterium]|nr:hypothetical protein [Planctomycetota bacterium]
LLSSTPPPARQPGFLATGGLCATTLPPFVGCDNLSLSPLVTWAMIKGAGAGAGAGAGIKG